MPSPIKKIPSREVVIKHYQETHNYKLTAEFFNVSRQRVHQIVTGYRTIKYKKSKKIQKLLAKNCERCGLVSTVIHHRDHDSRNNIKENLMPLCEKCHRFIHSFKNGVIRKDSLLGTPCRRCGRILGKEVELAGNGYCGGCVAYLKYPAKRRYYVSISRTCIECEKPYLLGKPFRKGFCNTCWFRNYSRKMRQAQTGIL